MPTIIDSLVVTLGLDPSNFSAGATDAVDKLKKLEEANDKKAKSTQESAKKESEALGGLKTQALELFGVFIGATGLKDFVAGTIHAGATVGRLSRAIGVSADQISRWQGVAREFGSSGEAMAGAFQSLSDVFTAWQVGGPEAPGIMQIFRAINTEAARLDAANAKTIDGTKGVNAALLATASNLKIIHDLAQDKNLASYLAEKIPGMDAGMFDMLIRGSDTLADNLKKVHGWTDDEAEAAGRLERRWKSLEVTTENFALHGLFGAIDGIASYFHDMGRVITIVSGGKDPGPGGFTVPSVNSQQVQPKSDATSAAYRNAVASIESRGSGGYAAVGPVTSSGDRAYGRYQVMGNNVGEWSQDALGKKISIAEFMASPELQDKIFDHRFGQYVKQFGNAQDAASAWFTGQPLSSGANRRDLYGTSGASYAQRFAAALPSGSSTTTSVAINGPITINAGPNASASDIAGKLRDLGMKRQAEANQSFVGGE